MAIIHIPYSYQSEVVPLRGRKAKTVTIYDTLPVEVEELEDMPEFVAAHGIENGRFDGYSFANYKEYYKNQDTLISPLQKNTIWYRMERKDTVFDSDMTLRCIDIDDFNKMVDEFMGKIPDSVQKWTINTSPSENSFLKDMLHNAKWHPFHKQNDHNDFCRYDTEFKVVKSSNQNSVLNKLRENMPKIYLYKGQIFMGTTLEKYYFSSPGEVISSFKKTEGNRLRFNINPVQVELGSHRKNRGVIPFFMIDALNSEYEQMVDLIREVETRNPVNVNDDIMLQLRIVHFHSGIDKKHYNLQETEQLQTILNQKFGCDEKMTLISNPLSGYDCVIKDMDFLRSLITEQDINNMAFSILKPLKAQHLLESFSNISKMIRDVDAENVSKDEIIMIMSALRDYIDSPEMDSIKKYIIEKQPANHSLSLYDSMKLQIWSVSKQVEQYMNAMSVQEQKYNEGSALTHNGHTNPLESEKGNLLCP